MDMKKLLEAKDELMEMPMTELNLGRLADVLIVLERIEDMQDDIPIAEEEKEVVEDFEAAENYYMTYIEAKRTYQLSRTEENKLIMTEKLKLVLSDMQEAIADIWSNADTAEEKQFIIQMVNKAYNIVK